MSFELNKIAGAILGTLLLVMGLGFLAEAIYAPIEGRGPGYTLPEPDGTGEVEVVEVAEATPLPVLLASASADEGARAVRKCQSCHNFEEGAGNKTGPGLYDIVGRTIAEHGGFSYSDALVAYGAEHGEWDYTTLAAFIHNPREDVPGTKMTFAGIANEEELANILAYLQTLSANPVAFPEPAAEVEVAANAGGETGEEMLAEEATTPEEQAPAAEAVEVETGVPAETDPDGAVEGSNPETAVVIDEPVAEEAAVDETTVEDAAEAEMTSEDETVAEQAPDAEAADSGIAVPAATDAEGAEQTSNSEITVANDGPVAEEAVMDETAVAEAAAGEETAPAEAVANEPATAGDSDALEAAIAAASLDEGEAVMRKCRTCHDWSEDGRNKVGPLLYDVVGRSIAAVESYRYSDAMKAFADENGEWSYALLDAFLTDPRGVVPGTKMTFAGLDDPADRAAAIAFLRAQSGAPLPLAGAE